MVAKKWSPYRIAAIVAATLTLALILIPDGRPSEDEARGEFAIHYPERTLTSIKKIEDEVDVRVFRVTYTRTENAGEGTLDLLFMQQPDGSWLLSPIRPHS